MVSEKRRMEVNPNADLSPASALETEFESAAVPLEREVQPSRKEGRGLLSALSLRTKVTALAIAISTLPVLGIGGLAYWETSHALAEKTIQAEQNDTATLTDKLNRFLFERYGDIQVLANLPILNNPTGTAGITPEQKSQILTDYTQTYGVYDGIAVYDLQGQLVLKSSQPADTTIKDTPEFQQVLQSGERVISEPQTSTATQATVMYFLSPIRNVTTNQIVGVVRSRMPITFLEEVVRDFDIPGQHYGVVDANGTFFIESSQDRLGQQAEANFPFITPFRSQKSIGTEILVDPVDGHRDVITYAPFEELEGIPRLDWGAMVFLETDVAFAARRQLLLTLLLGTLATSVLAAAIATFLANRATRPIRDAAQAVEKIGQGDLSARLQVKGEDELAVLGTNINSMATQIQTLVAEQQAETDRIEQARQEARQEADARAIEQQQQKEFLQKRALELLMEVDPVSRGDLTIRANVTPDEIGTIADSYNAIIRSLRQIVNQVKDASQSVTVTAQDNEDSVKKVSMEVAQQAETILAALNQIEMMAQSSQGVSERARQAAAQMKQANQVVQAGDEAMNRTVAGISTIRETVSETAKKVKRLGEASQKISKVVNLISGFAAQTNLLALNAAIEAARAGEEGRGFSVVAEEVRALAQQSATATAEIEQLVEEIQTQTNEVVTAMEAGTEQVVAGTHLVEESRQKLNQISAVSTQVNQLIQEIAQAASSQTQASTNVSHTMQSVAAIASESSKQSEAVAKSFSQLLDVAQSLQVSVAQFKVS